MKKLNEMPFSDLVSMLSYAELELDQNSETETLDQFWTARIDEIRTEIESRFLAIRKPD